MSVGVRGLRVPPPVVSRTCRFFFPPFVLRLACVWKGIKEWGFGGVTHVLKLLPDKNLLLPPSASNGNVRIFGCGCFKHKVLYQATVKVEEWE